MNLKTTLLYTTTLLGLGIATMHSQSIKRIKNIKPSIVEVTPNPTHGDLYINSDDKILSVLAYDIAGTTVIEASNIDDKKFQTSMNALPNGLYIVKTETNNGVYTTRLIKY